MSIWLWLLLSFLVPLASIIIAGWLIASVDRSLRKERQKTQPGWKD